MPTSVILTALLAGLAGLAGLGGLGGLAGPRQLAEPSGLAGPRQLAEPSGLAGPRQLAEPSGLAGPAGLAEPYGDPPDSTAGPARAASDQVRSPAERDPGPWWPPLDGPVPPRPVRGFTPPPVPWAGGHRGVDLAGAAEQPVRAAGGGVVTYAGSLAGRGVVVVSHGRLRTTYEPVTAMVRVGDRVGAGEVLGVLQPQGHCAAQPCLHWGLRRGESYLNPLALFGSGPARLLPVWPAAPESPG